MKNRNIKWYNNYHLYITENKILKAKQIHRTFDNKFANQCRIPP